MKYAYLLIDIGTILIPVVFSFHPKLRFDQQWRNFFPGLIWVGLFFIIWDIYFTKIGVWGFNPDYLTGWYIFNLPIEEILFFVCIPYACVFTYHCFNRLLPEGWLQAGTGWLTWLLLAGLTITWVLAFPRYYTNTTFALMALCLIYVLVARPGWITAFYISYGVCIVPFFVVNGLLTGSWIESPIVWYNDAENLGFRLATIPVEDIFYGMLLIFMNVYFLEFYTERSKRQ